ncbi:hypothetical protein [Stenotrophomonas phage RAS14]
MINSKEFEKSKYFAYRECKFDPYRYLCNVAFHFNKIKKTYVPQSLLQFKNTAWQIILLQETPPQ